MCTSKGTSPTLALTRSSSLGCEPLYWPIIMIRNIKWNDLKSYFYNWQSLISFPFFFFFNSFSRTSQRCGRGQQSKDSVVYRFSTFIKASLAWHFLNSTCSLEDIYFMPSTLVTSQAVDILRIIEGLWDACRDRASRAHQQHPGQLPSCHTWWNEHVWMTANSWAVWGPAAATG